MFQIDLTSLCWAWPVPKFLGTKHLFALQIHRDTPHTLWTSQSNPPDTLQTPFRHPPNMQQTPISHHKHVGPFPPGRGKVGIIPIFFLPFCGKEKQSQLPLHPTDLLLSSQSGFWQQCYSVFEIDTRRLVMLVSGRATVGQWVSWSLMQTIYTEWHNLYD